MEAGANCRILQMRLFLPNAVDRTVMDDRAVLSKPQILVWFTGEPRLASSCICAQAGDLIGHPYDFRQMRCL